MVQSRRVTDKELTLLTKFDRSLKEGDSVQARWRCGEFQFTGFGKIVKLYKQSVRVQVSVMHEKSKPWKLKQEDEFTLPRVQSRAYDRWHLGSCVLPPNFVV